ncbi:MAG TPA: hypothetical protein VFQ52_08350, partial [Rhizomicrobium sp.]|nr:hypothetical protein [Rhizomicrobium sp.]
MSPLLKQPRARENPKLPCQLCNPANVLLREGQVPSEKDKPRQIADGALPILASGIRPDIFYGLSPIVPFQFWAEVRCFKPGLGFAVSRSPVCFPVESLPSWNLLFSVSPA